MSKSLSNIVAIVLMVISAIIGIYTFIRCISLDAKIEEEYELMIGAIDIVFYWTYILLAIAILALIVTPIPYIITNPGVLKNFGIGIVAIGIVILLAYLFSSDAPLPFLGPVEEVKEKNSYSLLADLNIISMYIMSIAAIAAIAFSGVRNMIISRR